MKSITDIKHEFLHCPDQGLQELISAYEADQRAGVLKLVQAARKRHSGYEKELLRIKEMAAFERSCSEQEYICGVDEVGRGPLAGPVVAAAVILPKDCLIPYINDSKKLSPVKREKLFEEIMNSAISVGFGSVDNTVIDEVNILNATFRAMNGAIGALSKKPDFVLVDGNKMIPGLSIPQKAVVKGDEKSLSIAAASIMAKVLRDRQMEEFHKHYPMYDFASNKGYGSKKHMEGLRAFGLSPIHRKTFVHLG